MASRKTEQKVWDRRVFSNENGRMKGKTNQRMGDQKI